MVTQLIKAKRIPEFLDDATRDPGIRATLLLQVCGSERLLDGVMLRPYSEMFSFWMAACCQ